MLEEFGKIQEILRESKSRSDEGYLEFHRQLFEMVLLRVFWGIGPGYYHQAGFWRRDIPWSDKIDHLGSRSYERRIDRLNPPNYRKLSQNKIAEKAILGGYGIPTPKLLGFLHPTFGRTTTGMPLRNPRELSHMLVVAGLSRVCFKMVEGWAGRGFIPASVELNGDSCKIAHMFEGSPRAPEEFCRRYLTAEDPSGRIVEAYVNQHDWYGSLNRTSVNTYRVWAIQKVDEWPVVIGAYLRFGLEGAIVDNSKPNAIVVPVDLETGRLTPPIGLGFDRVPHRMAPSGVGLDGVSPAYLSEVLEVAKTALSIFPKIRFAGIDVAVSRDGPQVLELNVFPDKEAATYLDLPSARYLVP